jgi:hypothetical protein
MRYFCYNLEVIVLRKFTHNGIDKAEVKFSQSGSICVVNYDSLIIE